MRNLHNKLAKTDIKESNMTKGVSSIQPTDLSQPKRKKELTKEIIKYYKNNKQLNCN